MQHCKAIHSILRLFHLFGGLQKEFNSTDVGGDFGVFLLIATALVANHFICWWLGFWHVTGCWGARSRLHKRKILYMGGGEKGDVTALTCCDVIYYPCSDS